MQVDENTGAPISLAVATQYISDFRSMYPDEIHSQAVGRNHIENLLEQADCKGIRIYNGYKSNDKTMCSILVGYDSNGDDIAALLIDEMVTCPPICPKNSIFNP